MATNYVTSAETGPMFIRLPPGLADLRDYRLEKMREDFQAPPGLSKQGDCFGDILSELEPVIIEGGCSKEGFPGRSESDGTRSTDEPSTPEAPRDLFGAFVSAKKVPQAFDDPWNPEVPCEAMENYIQPWSPEFDQAEIEAALEPVLKEILGQEKPMKKGKDKAPVRWWTRFTSPLLCPLSGFPTCLLPYPPFKLRVDPTRSAPHRLVDGKYLAMSCVVTGRYFACGRPLQASDISALDDYVHRCKLGPYRPGRALALTQQAANKWATPAERECAAQELRKFMAAARSEFGKLRRIQENRLIQIQQALPPHLQAAIQFETSQPTVAVNWRKASMMSMASTRASISSDWSVESA
eukprot:Skav216046  [mRNA]  locus=scaffold2930:213553:214611:+ [translate_table: standard]